MSSKKPPEVPALSVRYDAEFDLVWIAGMAYSGQMFRLLGFAGVGDWLRVEAREQGALSFFRASEELGRTFDAISGRGRIKAKR